MKRSAFCLLFSLILSSCAPKDHQAFVKKADRVFVSMIRVLEQVEHSSDIYLIAKLNPYYQQIAELVIMSKLLEEKKRDVFSLEILEAASSSKLREHLQRIYSMEGGQAACEAAARDGLALLKKHSAKSKLLN